MKRVAVALIFLAVLLLSGHSLEAGPQHFRYRSEGIEAPAGAHGHSYAYCPAGFTSVGGGFENYYGTDGIHIYASYPYGRHGFLVVWANTGAEDGFINVRVVCISI